MDLKQAREVIQNQFNTAWNNETPIAWDNVDMSATGSEFVRVSIQPNTGGQQTLGHTGNRLFRLFGFVFIQVFTPKNNSASRNDFLAQLALNAFHDSSSEIRFYNPHIRYIGSDGGYFQQNVAIEFNFDQIK